MKRTKIIVPTKGNLKYQRQAKTTATRRDPKRNGIRNFKQNSKVPLENWNLAFGKR
jgi:hypothetical protein